MAVCYWRTLSRTHSQSKTRFSNLFKGSEQRRLGYVASFAVWGVLAINTLAQFAIGYSDGGWFGSPELPAPLLFYVRYILPLSIVAVPYLWK